MLDYSPVPGAVHGYDFAGIIVALGPDTPSHLSVGDRVAGFVHGMNPSLPEVGAFAEFVAAPANLLLRIPAAMSFTDAASLGLGLFTAGLGLFRELGIPLSLEGSDAVGKGWQNPAVQGKYILIAGGSTSTGTRAIQLAKLYVIRSDTPSMNNSTLTIDLGNPSAGLRPVATSSRKHFELARRFGAEQVFDYSDPDCAAKIRAYTCNTLEYAFDVWTKPLSRLQSTLLTCKYIYSALPQAKPPSSAMAP